MRERDTALSRTDHDALGAFVESLRPWGRVPVTLPPGIPVAFAAVALVNLAVVGWALIVLAAGWPCTGLFLGLSTMGGRPVLQLALSAGCVLGTVLLACAGGLVRAGAVRLAALTLTSTLGVVAAAGAVLALLLAALTVAVTVAVLLAMIERF